MTSNRIWIWLKTWHKHDLNMGKHYYKHGVDLSSNRVIWWRIWGNLWCIVDVLTHQEECTAIIISEGRLQLTVCCYNKKTCTGVTLSFNHNQLDICLSALNMLDFLLPSSILAISCSKDQMITKWIFSKCTWKGLLKNVQGEILRPLGSW